MNVYKNYKMVNKLTHFSFCFVLLLFFYCLFFSFFTSSFISYLLFSLSFSTSFLFHFSTPLLLHFTSSPLLFHSLLIANLSLFFNLDIEWKVTYVGCANDPTQDQVLEEVLVGPVSVGVNNFVLTSPAPDYNVIAVPDLLGVTVLLITCSYLEQEFVRIGYYVNNEYNDPSYNPEEPLPSNVDINSVYRNILADRPIVTRLTIDWSGQGGMPMPPPEDQVEGEGEQQQQQFQLQQEQLQQQQQQQYQHNEGIIQGGVVLLEEDSMDVERMQAHLRRKS